MRFLWRALSYRLRRNRHELAALRRHIAPGDTVIDIGSHKGGFLYWLVRFAGPRGRVYAFEPQPQLAAYLRQIVARCGWTTVRLEEAAVSDRAGTLDLLVPAVEGQTSPGATLAAAGAEAHGPHHRVRVPVITLDEYFPADVGRVTAIKIDVEGHELEAFRGAERLLRESRPVLLFECEARHMAGGRTPLDVFAHLQARGYCGQFFSPHGLRPIDEFRLDVHQCRGEGQFWRVRGYCNNFLFVPDAGQA